MTNKEEKLIKLIESYYLQNNTFPTIRELQKILNYKSSTSIHQFLKSLEKKKYLKKDKHNHYSLINKPEKHENKKCINTNDTIKTNFNKTNIILFKIYNNYLKKEYQINTNDILIIDTSKKLKNNNLGLFIINNKYRIMKYKFIDGFYILEDKEKEILIKVKIIGKVIGIYRKL